MTPRVSCVGRLRECVGKLGGEDKESEVGLDCVYVGVGSCGHVVTWTGPKVVVGPVTVLPSLQIPTGLVPKEWSLMTETVPGRTV